MIAKMKCTAAVALALCVAAFATLQLRPVVDERGARFRDVLVQRISGRDAVLIGNSVLQKGVNVSQLCELTGKDITRVWSGGSASAWWYLAVKNVVLQADPKPGTAVIVFRDEYLTRPDYRVDGGYGDALQLLSAGYEPEVEKLAHGRGGGRLKRWLKRHWRLCRHRRDLRESFEEGLKRRIESLFPGIESGEFEEAADDLFDEDQLDERLLQDALDEAEEAGTVDVLDFDSRVDASFCAADHRSDAVGECAACSCSYEEVIEKDQSIR